MTKIYIKLFNFSFPPPTSPDSLAKVEKAEHEQRIAFD